MQGKKGEGREDKGCKVEGRGRKSKNWNGT